MNRSPVNVKVRPMKLIKYGNPSCGPCRMLAPIIKDIVENTTGLEFEDINTFEVEPDILINDGIRSVPTLILLKDDKEVWRHVGLLSKDIIIQNIQKHNV